MVYEYTTVLLSSDYTVDSSEEYIESSYAQTMNQYAQAGWEYYSSLPIHKEHELAKEEAATLLKWNLLVFRRLRQ